MDVYERKIDELGRIVLPREIQRVFNLKSGDSVSITNVNGKVTLAQSRPRCPLCGAADDYHTDIGLCSACIAKVKGM